MVMMSKQILTTESLIGILTTLINTSEDEEKITLEFDSDQDVERFRQALYKQKRVLDEIMLMTDPTFVQRSMKFDVDPFPTSEHVKVNIWLYTQKKNAITFRILDRSENHNAP